MAELTRADLKEFFETNDFPTQAQFADLIDSLFALIDDNTVTKVIIVNVPTVGDGSGGKILKRANAVIAMGEFGGDDTAITSDNGAFVSGGSLFIAPGEAALYFNGIAFIFSNDISTILNNPIDAADRIGFLSKDRIGMVAAGSLQIVGTFRVEASNTSIKIGDLISAGIRQIIFDATGIRIGGSNAAPIAFHGEAPVVRQSVGGSRGGNVALANLLTVLDTKGLINDNTTI